jgi:hypothetical protein
MAISASGQCSFSTIQTEHGGSSPISLSEYYAGGSYVYANTSGNNGDIPSSGEISVDDLRGSATLQTLTTLFSNAVDGYNIGYDIAVTSSSNATANDSSYASWDWSSTPQTGELIRFYNPVSTLPADAHIIDIEFEATWGSGAAENTKRLFPRIQTGASSMTAPVSTTPDTRMNNGAPSISTDSISGDLTDWGVSNATAVSACRNTSATTSDFPAWVCFASNAGTLNLDTNLDYVRLIVQYVQ